MKTRKASKVIKEILNKIEQKIEEKAKRVYPDELLKYYCEDTLDLFREAYIKGYKEGFRVGGNKISDWIEENNDEIISDGHGGFTTIKKLESEQCITNCDTVTQNIINNETESDWVDLGLPSGTLWATCNVGATSPEEYGKYYDFDEAMELGVELPTKEQIKELIDECTGVWIPQNDKYGCLFTGPNGNSLFLPASGYYSGPLLDRTDIDGYYWSGTRSDHQPDRACYLKFDLNDGGLYYYCGSRCIGQSVRAVKSKG